VLLAGVLYLVSPVRPPSGTATPGDGPGRTTASLVAAVCERLTSIDSVYCEGETQFVSEKPVKYRYARRGEMWHYTEPTRDGRDNTSCFDGEHEFTFAVGHPRENPRNWTSVQSHGPRKNDRFGPDGLLGAVIANLRCSVVDVLGSAKEIAKSDEVLPDGSPGFRLVVREVKVARPGVKEPFVVAVTVDPAHDFLPREVLVTPSGVADWSEDWKVLEYRQVIDERTGGKRWFPVRGTMSHKLEVRIRDVRVNANLPSTLFHPSPPDGVAVVDVTPAGNAKAAAERIAKAFDQPGTLHARVTRALEDARPQCQRLLIVRAEPRSKTCRQLFACLEDDQSSPALADYALLPVRTEAASASDIRACLQSPPRPEATDRKPLLWVADSDGKLLATAGPDAVSKDGRIDRRRLVDFLKAYAPKLPDAEELLAASLARAVRDDKRVLLEESGAYCGWCVRLARFIEAHGDLLGRDYVPVTIDRRFGHGRQVMDRVRTRKDGSIPWLAILDAKGKVLVTSDGPKGNIGYPNKPETIEHFLKMLGTTARRLTPEQLAALRRDLETAGAATARAN
jgi:hypothetical protein